MIDYKAEAQKQWNANPCGTGDYLAGLEPESRAYFDAIREQRYSYNSWMDRVIDWNIGQGGKLLEIGHGIGTDLMRFAEHGAEVHGIDITEEHHRLARRNFDLHGIPCELKLCDAAAIDYPAEFFDVVYSFGVFHHTPDAEQCVAEAWRVLKPGGTLILGLYHRYSAFHIYTKLLYEGIMKGRLFTLGYGGLMATIEAGADGKSIKPLVRTYSRRRVHALLSRFSRVDSKIAHFKRIDMLPRIGRLVPRRWERFLESRIGWYVIAFAAK